ncbi:hypothetical protein R1A27_06415 [Methylobacterium sp. NMS12]|uniref:hypothetical protein n=1 Tax=Methylobacterium sp. NMS12 TaxID=3079766 RepID=UPI003F880E3A
MDDDAEPFLDPYEALRIIEVFIRVAEEADNADAPAMILREIRGVLAKAVPRKPRRKRWKA